MHFLNKTALSAFFTFGKLTTLSKWHFGVVKFNLPDLGQKIKEGTIKRLYVKEGDAVEQFQKLADVASDKQFTELTAANTGIIKKIYYQEEDVCQVGDLFLELQVKGESSETSPTPAKQEVENTKIESQQEKKPEQKKETSKVGEIMAAPFVRGLIKKYGLDINSIQGTGPGGRILEKDVEKVVNKGVSSTSTQAKAQPSKQRETPQPAFTPRTFTSSEVKTVSMSPFEKGMQKSMTESNTIPHLYLHEQIDITEVERMRKSLKESNRKVTVMGILIKTFSLALKQFPKMNATYQPSVNPYEYTISPNHNVSIAIDSQNGLVVPHIKNVQNLNLGHIQLELERLRNLAQQAKLTGKELQGGTICLSNIGTIGGVNACPLILPPQVCIVAIGKLQAVPRYRNGELSERKVINVSFGCDHRVIDGATAARFSNCWKGLIENPYISMAEMI